MLTRTVQSVGDAVGVGNGRVRGVPLGAIGALRRWRSLTARNCRS